MQYYGEVNANGERHGRGINIYNGHIKIGYYENGEYSTGKYISITSDDDY
jgi:hypothetical protein